jgi:hypothetical protein
MNAKYAQLARGAMAVTAKRALLVVVAATTAIAIASLGFGTAAHAGATETPLTTACPAGYDLLSVDALEATGPYVKPRRIDTSGNNNGYVCGLALPDSVRTASCKLGSAPACALAALDLPVYAVKDDDNPASQTQVDE